MIGWDTTPHYSGWDKIRDEARAERAREEGRPELSPELEASIERLRALSDEMIDCSDIPEVTDFSGFKRRHFK